jgi:hypothetical protein
VLTSAAQSKLPPQQRSEGCSARQGDEYSRCATLNDPAKSAVFSDVHILNWQSNDKVERHAAALFQPKLIYQESSIPSDVNEATPRVRSNAS